MMLVRKHEVTHQNEELLNEKGEKMECISKRVWTQLLLMQACSTFMSLSILNVSMCEINFLHLTAPFLRIITDPLGKT